MIVNDRFFRLGIRTFFLQVLWNFEKMQNIGFLFIFMTELKKMYKDDAQGYNNALKKHLEFFNIHPYMVGIVVGIVLGMEEKAYLVKDDRLKSEKISHEISNIKATMAGPLSAIGDSFFWGLWRPFVSLVIFILFFIFYAFNPPYVYKIWFVLSLYLALYNLPHFVFRFEGIKKAYNMGTNVIVYIKRWHDFDFDKKFRKIGLFLCVLVFFIFCLYKHYDFLDILKCLLLVIVFELLKRKSKMTTITLMFYVLIIFIGLVYLKVV
jgi:PTS system mannose-specific IID component